MCALLAGLGLDLSVATSAACYTVLCPCYWTQLFWIALALLHCPVVGVYMAALDLLAAITSRLPLHRAKVQNVLLAAAPGGRSGHVLMLQHAAGGAGGAGVRGSGGMGAPAWGSGADIARPGLAALADDEPGGWGVCDLVWV